MATLQTTKTTSTANNALPGIGDGQGLKCIAGSYTWAAAPASGDVIKSPSIPKGAVIVDVAVSHTGFGASGAFEVGYGGDTDYFATAAAAVAGGVVRKSAATAQPLALTESDTVDVLMTGTGAAAAGTVSIEVYFLPVNA